MLSPKVSKWGCVSLNEGYMTDAKPSSTKPKLLRLSQKDVSNSKVRVKAGVHSCARQMLKKNSPAHNFFNPQPIKNADIFFMRFISHDWPTPTMKIILKHLRASAQSTTKLILADRIVLYAAPSADKYEDIPGSVLPPAPTPLLANFGIATGVVNLSDMKVCSPSLTES